MIKHAYDCCKSFDLLEEVGTKPIYLSKLVTELLSSSSVGSLLLFKAQSAFSFAFARQMRLKQTTKIKLNNSKCFQAPAASPGIISLRATWKKDLRRVAMSCGSLSLMVYAHRYW